MPEDAIASASISCPWLLESDPLIPDKLTAFANTSLEFGSSLPCKKFNSFIKSSASIVSEADAIDLIAALYCTLYLVVSQCESEERLVLEIAELTQLGSLWCANLCL